MKGTAGDLRRAVSRPRGQDVAGPTFSIGTPRVLFEGDYVEEQPGQDAHSYDVAGDGRRFIMMTPAPQQERENAPHNSSSFRTGWKNRSGWCRRTDPRA